MKKQFQLKWSLAILLGIISLSGHGQVQIGDDIDGEAAGDESGWSVSLSSDGSVLAIGAPRNDENGNFSGHVRVYGNNGGTWQQIGADIDGEAAGDFSGTSVSLSSDGSVLAIGAPGNGPSSGHVRVYGNNGGTWVQIGDDIDGEAAGDFSGISVSLSSDGSVLAIGAYLNDENGMNSGHVRVYKNNGGAWEQIGDDIDGEAANDNSGTSVSLSSDGSVLAIGAEANDGNGPGSGHVRVYGNNRGAWEQIGDDIDGEAAGDFSGISVSLSSDGSVLAIGAIGNDENGQDSGHVRVYGNNGGTWQQIGADIDGEAAGDQLGWGVSLSSDGTVLAIGAIGNDENGNFSGHVRVYGNNRGTWEQIGDDIDGEAAGDASGESISLSSDGTVLAIGGPNNDENGTDSGHVQVYHMGSGVSVQAPSTVSDLEEFTITIKFDRDVSGFSGEDIELTNAEVIDLTTVSLSEYRAEIQPISLCDVITIDVPEGSVSDTGYNLPNGAANQVIVDFEDIIAPTVVVHDNITVALVNGSVTIDAADINNGSTDNCTSEADLVLSVSPSTFNSVGIHHGITLTVEDASGNSAIATATVTVVAEETPMAPTVSISNAPSSVADLAAFTVDIAFSDAVTGFTAGDIEVTNATTSNFTGSGSTYSVDIAPTSLCDGDIGIAVPAGVAVGAASGLGNVAANQVIVDFEDTMPPSVVVHDNITLALVNGNVTIDAADINNGSTDNCTSEADLVLSVSTSTFNSVGIHHGITLTVTDASGNSAEATVTVTVVAEETPVAPTVSISNAPSSVADLAAFTVDIAFSDAVTGFEQGDITVTNATTSNFTGSGSTYSVDIAPTSLCDGDIGIDVPAGVAVGAASGLNNVAANQVVVSVEDTKNLVAITQDITVQLDANGQVTITPEQVDNGSNYGCSNTPELSLDRNTFTCNDAGDTVTVTLTATQGNNSDTATAIVTVEANGNCELGPLLVDFNRGFSPNADGIGDTLVIEGLEAYGNNVVKIYDLSQRLLFSAHYGGPGDGWDGTHKGGMVPVGSYVCVIDYNEPGLGHEAKMIYVNY